MFVTLAAAALTGPAHALLIVPTFDLNPAGDVNSLNNTTNPAAEVAAINTAISTIDNLYSNPGTVYVLFNFNSGVFGQSQNEETFVPYSQYTGQLAANSAANPGNKVLASAVANLSKGNTADYVLGTTAFLRVGMGFVGPGTTPALSAGGFPGPFDGIISVNNLSTSPTGPGQNSQATSVVEHELNEVLGGGGTGTTIGENLAPFLCPGQLTCKLTAIGPTDPYRYQSAGPTCANVNSTPGFTTAFGVVACYSVDGGQTSLVQMNQAGGGSDYGDFATTSPNIPYIQDAFSGGTTDDYSQLSPEFTMLESIGYDANVPEPSTMALFGGMVVGLGWIRRRRA
jgi:hypothetical protein